LSLPELLDHLVDPSDHVEVLLRNFVVLAFDDFLEAADGVGDLDVLAFEPGELLGDEEGLHLAQPYLRRLRDQTGQAGPGSNSVTVRFGSTTPVRQRQVSGKSELTASRR
jgi:hypothetical protein